MCLSLTRRDWFGGRFLRRLACGRFGAGLLAAAFFGTESRSRAATARLLWLLAGLTFDAAALAFDDGFGKLVQDDLDRPHRVIVAGNRKVDQIGVADAMR